MFHVARPLMLSPKRERKMYDDRMWSAHRQPLHSDNTKLRRPTRQPEDIRGSAQNLMGMVQHRLLLLSNLPVHVLDNL